MAGGYLGVRNDSRKHRTGTSRDERWWKPDGAATRILQKDGWQCAAKEPAAETYDGVSNDCDPDVDEGRTEAAPRLYNTAEHCGLGNSCWGARTVFATATDCAVIGGEAKGGATTGGGAVPARSQGFLDFAGHEKSGP